MTCAYYFFFFIFTLVSKLWIGRQNAVGSNETRLYLIIFKLVCPYGMSTSEVGIEDFQMFTTELT